MTELTDDHIIKVAATAGARAFHDSLTRQKALSREKKFEKVGLILDHYHALEEHINVDLPHLTDEEQDNMSFVPKRELTLYATIGFKVRSKLMVQFIDSALSAYKGLCASSTDESVRRRYPVIELLYLNNPAIDQANCAEHFSVDERTIRRTIIAAKKDLAVIIFGIDAIPGYGVMS